VLEAANDNVEDGLCVELMLAVADSGVVSANLNFVVSDMEAVWWGKCHENKVLMTINAADIFWKLTSFQI
jgi:hypothetical protein